MLFQWVAACRGLQERGNKAQRKISKAPGLTLCDKVTCVFFRHARRGQVWSWHLRLKVLSEHVRRLATWPSLLPCLFHVQLFALKGFAAECFRVNVHSLTVGRPANAIEFEAQLESRAKSTRALMEALCLCSSVRMRRLKTRLGTLAGIAEMHKAKIRVASACSPTCSRHGCCTTCAAVVGAKHSGSWKQGRSTRSPAQEPCVFRSGCEDQ